jgi:hypothetical protein
VTPCPVRRPRRRPFRRPAIAHGRVPAAAGLRGSPGDRGRRRRLRRPDRRRPRRPHGTDPGHPAPAPLPRRRHQWPRPLRRGHRPPAAPSMHPSCPTGRGEAESGGCRQVPPREAAGSGCAPSGEGLRNFSTSRQVGRELPCVGAASDCGRACDRPGSSLDQVGVRMLGGGRADVDLHVVGAADRDLGRPRGALATAMTASGGSGLFFARRPAVSLTAVPFE